MRVLTLKLISNDPFALIRIDILIFVTIVKANKDEVCNNSKIERKCKKQF